MQGTTPSQAVGWEEGSLRPHVWEALREAASTILRMPKKLTDCRNSCGDQKMLQTECFSHPARWI